MEVFEITSPIKAVKTITVGSDISDVERLRKIYVSGHWRKLKGRDFVCLEDGYECEAELY